MTFRCCFFSADDDCTFFWAFSTVLFVIIMLSAIFIGFFIYVSVLHTQILKVFVIFTLFQKKNQLHFIYTRYDFNTTNIYFKK